MRRCLVRVSVDGAFHAAGRSWASWRRSARSIFGPSADVGAQILNPSLELGHALQGAVPARLQLAGDMALGGIHKFVSARGEGGFISRRFEFPLDGGDDVRLRTLDLIRGEDRGFDRTIGDRLQDLQSDRAIDPNTADADAQSRTDMGVIAAALVAMGIAFRPCRRRRASSGHSVRIASDRSAARVRRAPICVHSSSSCARSRAAASDCPHSPAN